jgi:hypothetical protein
MSYLEEILSALYESEINASISWLWDGGIDVMLGDELNGCKAERKVSTFAEVTTWLRDQACMHYPDSGFAQKYCGFVRSAREQHTCWYMLMRSRALDLWRQFGRKPTSANL